MERYRFALKWGVIFTAMGLLWMLLERLLGLHDERIEMHAWATKLILFPAVLVYVLALREKKRIAYGGTMTYKQGFLAGVGITAVVTLLTPLSQLITSLVITPDYFSNMIAYSVNHGMLTQTEAEEYFSLSNYLLQSTVFAPIAGVVTSAIVAVFVRSKG
jgi:hypothetical protein